MKSDYDFKNTFISKLEQLMHSYMAMKSEIGNALEKEGYDMNSEQMPPLIDSIDPLVEKLLTLMKMIDDHMKKGRAECKARNIHLPAIIHIVEDEMARCKAAVKRVSPAH